ncbi:sigma-70 family RNA polymerase sigma factor [Micromonospora sp. WMMD718]|uniref:sigma-70 family RNA polymerase sigma factor n=1 Tax=Micromonospora sp. WMMD718 TaxID=3016098 RepID=UPI00241680FB|nr:sigma-70 family RNA polymerase sigma factor [Micromonospora sp. WMMD718]MDG4749342.1 sigma-70 family RNA polymerase sigma factor [Micromonospora sp. WMMD718]MDG4756084.1 sigma-70 family RNA polymerase sigma factor [Micromonospora sp. WMMD718]
MTAPTLVRVPAQPGPPRAEQAPEATWHLVTAAQAGDREAFAELFRRYRSLVFNIIYRRVNNRELAEDLTQDVFVRALKSIERVTWQGRDIGAWFVTIARNIVIDHFKSGRYRLESTIGDTLTHHLGIDFIDHTPEGNPAASAVAHLVNVELLTAVKTLTVEQQDVIVLRFLHGLSVAETAAALGKNEGAVKAVQYRACRTLARLLPPSIRETS